MVSLEITETAILLAGKDISANFLPEGEPDEFVDVGVRYIGKG